MYLDEQKQPTSLQLTMLSVPVSNWVLFTQYTIIKTTRLSVTEAVSVTGRPMHGKQT